jgi:Rrf2 family transcriptional regulator, iron-sulfur cluster assembly transcription factor
MRHPVQDADLGRAEYRNRFWGNFEVMILLSRRSVLAIGAVVDIALHARTQPVAAKILAARHDLAPRHLETVLQALVRHGILKGVRGPRGGYELSKDRRGITAGHIVRAAMESAEDTSMPEMKHSKLVDDVVHPHVRVAGAAFLEHLDGITVDDLCKQAESNGAFTDRAPMQDFSI